MSTFLVGIISFVLGALCFSGRLSPGHPELYQHGMRGPKEDSPIKCIKPGDIPRSERRGDL